MERHPTYNGAAHAVTWRRKVKKLIGVHVNLQDAPLAILAVSLNDNSCSRLIYRLCRLAGVLAKPLPYAKARVACRRGRTVLEHGPTPRRHIVATL